VVLGTLVAGADELVADAVTAGALCAAVGAALSVETGLGPSLRSELLFAMKTDTVGGAALAVADVLTIGAFALGAGEVVDTVTAAGAACAPAAIETVPDASLRFVSALAF
jgi:hypothetical protein